jgi:type I restriction enzyme M protein
VYQHLMTYWMETMQDDCYLLVSDGWKVGNEVEWTKKEFEGRLIPKGLLIHRYFEAEQKALEQLEASRDALAAQLEELEEEHSGEEGFFSSLDKVNKASVNAELKSVTAELKADKTNADLLEKKKVLEQYLKLSDEQAEANKKVKETKAVLDKKLQDKYPSLTEAEIKTLVVEDKWFATIENTVKNEMQRISQRLTQRIKELAERYETTLPALLGEVSQWEEKVNAHLAKMGFTWN